MHSRTAEFLERVRQQVLEGFTLNRMAEWIEAKTKIEGRPFSYKDHEYQRRLAEEQSREVVVKKPSQIGISE